MSEVQRRMLAILAKKRSPFPTGLLGMACWSGRYPRKPQHFARPAGNVLRALQRRGFADYEGLWGHAPGSIGWVITPAGREALNDPAL